MVVAPLRRRQLSEAAQVSLKRKKPPGKTGRFVVPGRAGANPEISAFIFLPDFGFSLRLPGNDRVGCQSVVTAVSTSVGSISLLRLASSFS